MILVDPRSGSGEFSKLFASYSIPVAQEILPFGDFAFSGNGPNGEGYSIGIERKALDDWLKCQEDNRFKGHQLPGMLKEYHFSIVVIEGVYRPDNEGYVEELVPCWDKAHARPSTEYFKWRRMSMGRKIVLFSQVSGHLNTMRFKAGTPNAGFMIVQTTDKLHTTFETAALYKWFQKPWEEHQSHIGFYDPASMLGLTSSLVRRVAMQIRAIGMDKSLHVDRQFESVMDMALKSATVDELQAAIKYRTEHPEDSWQQIKWVTEKGKNMSIGKATSADIHKQLRNGGS